MSAPPVGLQWERCAVNLYAFVICAACRRWQIVKPQTSGYVIDRCDCGETMEGVLVGWQLRLGVASRGTYDPSVKDGPGNTDGT